MPHRSPQQPTGQHRQGQRQRAARQRACHGSGGSGFGRSSRVFHGSGRTSRGSRLWRR
jgi:hypothetical protein